MKTENISHRADPLVTVIIVVYNGERYIENAIKSVLLQQYSNIELVVIDGGSEDDTAKVIGKYEEDISYWVSEQDSGVYDAMNKGIRHAKGEWVLFLGSDDELLPEGITTLVRSSYGCHVVYGDYKIMLRNGSISEKKSEDCDCIKRKSFTSHQSLMMRQEVVKVLGGFDTQYKVLADYDLLLRAYLQGYTFKRVSGIVAIFRAGGLSSDNIRVVSEKYAIIINNGLGWRAYYVIVDFVVYCLLIVKHRWIDNVSLLKIKSC